MYCRKCGNQLRKGALFCASCGTSISQVQSEEIQPEVIEEVIVPEQKIESLASNKLILSIILITMVLSIGLIIII